MHEELQEHLITLESPGGGGGVLLYIRYGDVPPKMGLYSPGKSLHMGPYFSQNKYLAYRWVPFSGLGVLTYFASISREIIPEILTPMIPPITRAYGEGWGIV